MIELLHGDCLERLKELPDCSVDACVTDPPYGLSFMGKAWDYDVPGAEVWREVLRVLKPGGHLLAFAGTRTQHRMAVQIEDAGFEIRDLIAWVYGSGFPKSLDVSKAIDKAAGAEREVLGTYTRATASPQIGNSADSGLTADGWRESRRAAHEIAITAPATPAAQQWAGWGTALKPALEPITVARKPFKGTVAANVLEHGTGAINVDGCRVAGVKGVPASPRKNPNGGNAGGVYGRYEPPSTDTAAWDANAGRWPANLIHDGSDEPCALLSDAARFFYCAKASKADRGDGNGHPTVKPTELMRYLCRLVTPPGGVVLDPFMGSGSTGKAAALEGFRFIGIEREAEYLEIARGRIQLPEQGALL
jgi:site-specific DNA-methyltransferase (adenine-specific)